MSRKNGHQLPDDEEDKHFEFSPRQPMSRHEIIACMAGLATSFGMILSNVTRLSQDDTPYPLTEEEKKLITDLFVIHSGVLRTMLKQDTNHPEFKLKGHNNFELTFHEDDLTDLWSSTEFDLLVPGEWET
jgi:hypothetical protein